MLSADRRRHRRYTLRQKIRVLTAASDSSGVIGQLMDLSTGGASITAAVDVAAGAGAFLHFRYRGQWLCEATGHIVRVLPFAGEHGIAVDLGVTNEEFRTFVTVLDQTPEALRPNLLGRMEGLQVRFG